MLANYFTFLFYSDTFRFIVSLVLLFAISEMFGIGLQEVFTAERLLHCEINVKDGTFNNFAQSLITSNNQNEYFSSPVVL